MFLCTPNTVFVFYFGSGAQRSVFHNSFCSAEDARPSAPGSEGLLNSRNLHPAERRAVQAAGTHTGRQPGRRTARWARSLRSPRAQSGGTAPRGRSARPGAPEPHFLHSLGFCRTGSGLSTPLFSFIFFPSSSLLPFLSWEAAGTELPPQTSKSSGEPPPESLPKLRVGNQASTLQRGAVSGCRLCLDRGHECRRTARKLPPA